MQKSMEEDKNAVEDDNIWDDKLLIKAYDESWKLTKHELAKRLAKETNKRQQQQQQQPKTNAIASTAGITVTLEVGEQGEQQQNENSLKNTKNPSTVENYKIGDYIRATYDDGVDYEAKILSINEDKQTCLLKYIGYGNEQEVNISDLVPSWGKKARRTQFNKSRQVSGGVNSDEADGDAGDNDMKMNCNKKSKMRRSHNLSDGGSGHQHQFENTSILPPPPPPMPPMLNELNEDSESLSAMLMSWYMSGYYTGLYQGQKMAKGKMKTKR